MPQVPQYQKQVGVAAAVAPKMSSQAPIEAFGGGQGLANTNQAAQKLSETISDTALTYIQQADEIVVTDAAAKAEKLRNDLIYNTQDGFMTKKGKDAFAIEDEYTKRWKDNVAELEKGLSNDRQRAAFQAQAGRLGLGLSADMQKYVAAQGEAYDVEVTKSRMEVAKNTATLNFGDPIAIDSSLKDVRGVIEAHAKRTGKSPEWIQAETTKEVSSVHRNVIDRMLTVNEPEKAQAYFSARKEQISGEDAEILEKALNEGNVRLESNRFADEVMKRGLTMSQAIEASNQIKDPKLKEASRASVKEAFSLQKLAKEEMETRRYERAVDILKGAKGNLNAVPPTLLASMKPNEVKTLRETGDIIANGIEPNTNLKAFYGLRTMAAQDPEGFKRRNLLLDRVHLNNQDWEETMKLQTQMKAGDKEATNTIDGYRSSTAIVNGTVDKLKIKDAGKKELFQRQVDDEIRAYEQRNSGKKPTTGEVQDMVDKLAIQVVTDKGFLYDTKKRLYELGPDEEVKAVPYKEIPIKQVRAIQKVLRDGNFPVSETAVAELYNQDLRKQRSGK